MSAASTLRLSRAELLKVAETMLVRRGPQPPVAEPEGMLLALTTECGWRFTEYGVGSLVDVTIRKIPQDAVEQDVDDLDSGADNLRVTHFVLGMNIARLELVEKLLAHRFEFFAGAVAVEHREAMKCCARDALDPRYPAGGVLVRHSDFSPAEWAALRAAKYPLARPHQFAATNIAPADLDRKPS